MAPAPMTATMASLGSAALIVSPKEGLSAAGELRRPLGGESFDALAIVVAVAKRALQVALDIELRCERVRGRRLQCLLDRGVATRGTLSQVRQQLVDHGLQLLVVDTL